VLVSRLGRRPLDFSIDAEVLIAIALLSAVLRRVSPLPRAPAASSLTPILFGAMVLCVTELWAPAWPVDPALSLSDSRALRSRGHYRMGRGARTLAVASDRQSVGAI
jgi:hypothetical protein